MSNEQMKATLAHWSDEENVEVLIIHKNGGPHSTVWFAGLSTVNGQDTMRVKYKDESYGDIFLSDILDIDKENTFPENFSPTHFSITI